MTQPMFHEDGWGLCQRGKLLLSKRHGWSATLKTADIRLEQGNGSHKKIAWPIECLELLLRGGYCDVQSASLKEGEVSPAKRSCPKLHANNGWVRLPLTSLLRHDG